MIQVQLTPKQRDLLREILEAVLADLRMEIADTDNSQFKQELRNRKQRLTAILEAVSAAGE